MSMMSVYCKIVDNLSLQKKVFRLVCYLKTLLYQKMAINKTVFGSYMLLLCHLSKGDPCRPGAINDSGLHCCLWVLN